MPIARQPNVPRHLATCGKHGAGYVLVLDRGNVCIEHKEWLWKRPGLEIAYDCGCTAQHHGPVEVNERHPAVRLLSVDAIRASVDVANPD